MNTKLKYAKLLPIMLCFFAMGFVDLVGIASNYVKEDLNLSDSEANIFPSLVFFWFLIFSVPTGILDEQNRKKENSITQPSGYICFAADSGFWRQLRHYALLILSFRNRQRTDADFA